MAVVVLLHPDREVAEHLGATIAAAPDLTIGGLASDLKRLRGLLDTVRPDVLIVDLRLRESHVRLLLSSLQDASGRPLVLVLALAADDPRLVDALRGGADGYFLQSRPAPSLPVAIRQLIAGESAMSPEIARRVKAQFEAAGRTTGRAALDAVEQQLLQWTAEGYVVDELARKLGVDPHIVGLRIRRIYRKLQRDCRPLGIARHACASGGTGALE